MTSKTRTILLAAVLSTPVAMLASPRSALAQYRVDTGNALDANNRIGSGGVNEARPKDTVNGNDIVTGNVTGGRQFRGNIGYSAPGAFTGGAVGVNTDRFIRQSSSAYDPNAQAVRPFYGQSYGAPPPEGFVATPNAAIASGQYLPAQPLSREAGDLRLGQITDTATTALPRAGEFMLPGQVETGNANSLVTASPLYGIRQQDGSSATDGSVPNPGFSNFNRNNAPGKQQGDDKTIQKMRDELRDNVITNDPNDKAANPPADPSDLGAKAKIQAPYESPEATPLGSQRLGSPLTGGTAMTGKVSPDQSTTNALVPAPVQSQQYAELTKRFKGLQNTSPTDQQVNEQFQKDLKARKAAEAKKDDKTAGGTQGLRPGVPRPGGAGSESMLPAAGGGGAVVPDKLPTPDNTTPDATATTAKPPVDDTVKVPDKTPAPANPQTPDETPKPDLDKGPAINTNSGMVKPGQPLLVKSLTDGMKPGGLKDTLATAEEQMRKGKYTSALDQYDLAERVVPNNPLVTMGRANAELGASYYARADASIRRALKADPALMLGQFDLNTFLGRDRVDFLEKDLKDITTTEPKSVRAPFLLAYLKYNQGDLKMASNYLALSEKRAGNPDPLYKQLRIYWALPTADPIPTDATPEMNK